VMKRTHPEYDLGVWQCPSSHKGFARDGDTYFGPAEALDPDRFMNPSKPEIPQQVDFVWGFNGGSVQQNACRSHSPVRHHGRYHHGGPSEGSGNRITPIRELGPGAITCGAGHNGICYRPTFRPPLDTRNLLETMILSRG